jgi:hypothetical protein
MRSRLTRLIEVILWCAAAYISVRIMLDLCTAH